MSDAADKTTPAAEAKPEETKKEETPAAEPAAEKAADGTEANPEEENTAADFKPLVSLPEVEVTTGEESEESVFKIRAKLFRFVKDTNEWKERGTGDIKLMKHKETGKVRVLMRREKTLKICANHYLNPKLKLGENSGNDRSWVWTAFGDIADDNEGTGEPTDQVLAIRFANSENAQLFKAAFEKHQKENEELENKK